MKTTTLTIRGTRPLLLHSDVACDPLNPAAIEIARMTKRKDKKTAEAQHEIARVEWEAGLYYDDEGGVHMPTWNIIRSIQDGARMSKSGKLIERAAMMVGMEIKSARYQQLRDLRIARADLGNDTSPEDLKTIEREQIGRAHV